eukprot:Phypoly_transcript_04982.p1 GENE.Phypoly_transcript_04982~~Phypoly_transcript_04982.p1  ORF type:complete len:459 (+),score=83.58 Phypoly_transcript_04982:428-1804(+)
MPTVLLVDVSLSLAHALQGEFLETYKELMQEGLLHLIQELEVNHPLELVSLVTFSSTGKVLVPFSRNFSALKTALYNIQLEDKTNVTAGLQTTIGHVTKTLGTTLPVQIILVTNGCKLGGEPELLNLEIPFPAKLHVIAYGEKSKIDVDLFSNLTWKTKGYFQFLELPQAAPLMRQAFASLLEAHYLPYQGLLACGHLQAPITLYPNPAQMSSPSSFPSLISIVGFIPNKRIPSPPVVSRYFVLPQPLPLPPSTHPLPPLLLVLHDILRTERLTAVARIDEQSPASKEWFCLINSVAADEKNARGAAHVGTHVSQMMSSVGRPQHPKSYTSNTKDNVLNGLTSDALLPHCSKIIRYAKSGKIELLYMECEKIRQTASTYCCADLLGGIAQMLIDELHVAQILDTVEGLGNPVIDLIKMLPNHATDTPLIYREKATSFPSFTPSNPPTSTQMSIHSLMN